MTVFINVIIPKIKGFIGGLKIKYISIIEKFSHLILLKTFLNYNIF